METHTDNRTPSDRIRAKIEKLRKLGEHPSSDPNEAAAALALAQRLMDEYGITEALLSVDDDEDDEQDVLTFDGSSEIWKGVILRALADVNGCASLRSTSERWARIWGRRGDVQTVDYLFRFCVAEVERLTKRNAMGRGRSYASAYRKGCASAIGRALRAESAKTRTAARAQYASDSKALIALDQWESRLAVAEQARRVECPRVGNSRGGRVSDRSGYERGLRDGAGVLGGRAGARIGGGAIRLGSGS